MSNKSQNILSKEIIQTKVDSTEITEQDYIFVTFAQSLIGIENFEGTTEEPSSIQSESTESKLDQLIPIMTREELYQTLLEFEQKYCMSSKEFYNLWLTGKAPHRIDSLKWVVLWEAWDKGYLL